MEALGEMGRAGRGDLGASHIPDAVGGSLVCGSGAKISSMNCQRILSTETSLERAYVQMQRNQESIWIARPGALPTSLHSLGWTAELQGKEGMANVKAASRAGVNNSTSAEINRPGLIFTHWALLNLNDAKSLDKRTAAKI